TPDAGNGEAPIRHEVRRRAGPRAARPVVAQGAAAVVHFPPGRSIMSELNGLRVAVLATDGFEDSELVEPVKALREAGAQVTILPPKHGEIQGVRHDIDKTIKVKVDRTVKDASAEEFDAVHLPGGALNADAMRMVPEVQAFLRAMQEAGKPLSVIC